MSEFIENYREYLKQNINAVLNDKNEYIEKVLRQQKNILEDNKELKKRIDVLVEKYKHILLIENLKENCELIKVLIKEIENEIKSETKDMMLHENMNDIYDKIRLLIIPKSNNISESSDNVSESSDNAPELSDDILEILTEPTKDILNALPYDILKDLSDKIDDLIYNDVKPIYESLFDEKLLPKIRKDFLAKLYKYIRYTNSKGSIKDIRIKMTEIKIIASDLKSYLPNNEKIIPALSTIDCQLNRKQYKHIIDNLIEIINENSLNKDSFNHNLSIKTENKMELITLKNEINKLYNDIGRNNHKLNINNVSLKKYLNNDDIMNYNSKNKDKINDIMEYATFIKNANNDIVNLIKIINSIDNGDNNEYLKVIDNKNTLYKIEQQKNIINEYLFCLYL